MCHIECDHDPLIKVLNPFKPRRRRRDVRFFPWRSISDQSAELLSVRGANLGQRRHVDSALAPMPEVWRGSLQHDTVNFLQPIQALTVTPDLTE
jgi:hypothetical protein